jgi:TRAP-type C4-dicarboxylate transport system substrate-binding protein
MKKKLVSLILVGAMAVSLGACGSSSSSATEQSNDNQQAVSEDATETEEITSDIDESSVTEADIAGAQYQFQLAVAVQDEDYIAGFPERVYALSNGQVGITTVALDSLGTSDDAVAMLKNGTIGMYFNSAAQTPTSFPVSDVFTIPYLFESMEQQNQAVYDLYEAGYLTEYDDQIVPLMFTATDPQMLVFASKQPQTTDELKGLQIRATSGTSITMIENMGASVVSMGFADVFLSLDRGVIDAAMSSPVMMDTNAWYDVTSYLMDENFFWGVCFCAVNKAQFEALPEDCQNAISQAAEEQHDVIMGIVQELGDAALADMQSNGVELYEVDDSMKEAFRTQAEELKEKQEETLTSNGYDGAAIMKVIEDSIAANPVQ